MLFSKPIFKDANIKKDLEGVGEDNSPQKELLQIIATTQ